MLNMEIFKCTTECQAHIVYRRPFVPNVFALTHCRRHKHRRCVYFPKSKPLLLLATTTTTHSIVIYRQNTLISSTKMYLQTHVRIIYAYAKQPFDCATRSAPSVATQRQWLVGVWRKTYIQDARNTKKTIETTIYKCRAPMRVRGYTLHTYIYYALRFLRGVANDRQNNTRNFVGPTLTHKSACQLSGDRPLFKVHQPSYTITYIYIYILV